MAVRRSLTDGILKLAYASDSIKPPALAGGKRRGASSSRKRAADESSAAVYDGSEHLMTFPPAKAGGFMLSLAYASLRTLCSVPYLPWLTKLPLIAMKC